MQGPKWPFLLRYVSRDTRRIDFHRLTGSQRTPGFWGVTLTLVPREEFTFKGFSKFQPLSPYRDFSHCLLSSAHANH